MAELLYEYMLSGTIDSDHRHFGGEDCYQEIPFLYHTLVAASVTIVTAVAMIRWFSQSVDTEKQVSYLAPNKL
jgi:hypothetical protein